VNSPFLKGTRVTGETLDVRLHGEDTTVVVTRGDTYKKAPGKLRKVQTYTMVRCADGRWRVTAFQNTMHKALMEAVSFRLLPASVPNADASAFSAADAPGSVGERKVSGFRLD
jgi:hypothetical protein